MECECTGVYVDQRFRSERWVHQGSMGVDLSKTDGMGQLSGEPHILHHTVVSLLRICKRIYLCHSGKSFAGKLAEVNERSSADCTPVLALIDIESRKEFALRRRDTRELIASFQKTLSLPPSRGFEFSSEASETHGIQLLSLLSSDLQLQEGPRLIIPIAILRGSEAMGNDSLSSNTDLLARCLDAGAVDVLTQPLESARVRSLSIHAYRTRRTAQKENSRFLAVKKSRKQSWVGVNDQKPYAYLREAMVSKLMKSICNPEEMTDDFHCQELDITDDRKALVGHQIGTWDFCAHDLSDDELVYAAWMMLDHAQNAPEVESWKLTPAELQSFCLACRAAYNSFVLYHNFRHAVDVLQFVFSMLLHIGALPPYGSTATSPAVPKSPTASLITPIDALMLMIAAIGHDVGHPGVNNVFLVKLNAPLAQLYNDSSVLESFHCAAFSQILRRHWPPAFRDTNLRKLLVSTILATDMGVHFKFMKRMSVWQQKIQSDHQDISSWSSQDLDTFKTLICGLLIKCADISNVARPWRIAEKWTNTLQDELINQGQMEKEVGMETALIGGPPEPGNLHKLANGQIGFMSMFALPLFEGVSELLPQLASAPEQIKSNRDIWQQKVDSVNGEKEGKELGSGVDFNAVLSPSQPVEATTEPERTNTATTQLHITLPEEHHSEDVATALPVQITLDQAPNEHPEQPSPGSQRRSSENEFDFSDCTTTGQHTAGSVGGTTLNSLDHSPQSPAEIKFDIQQTPETVLGIRCPSHPNRRSFCSVHGSLPSTSYGTGRDTRTQSASTGTNTMATPLSPGTNATSIAAGDSGDEDNSRPASSNPYTLNGRDHPRDPPRSNPTYPQLSHYIGDFGKGKGHRVMTTLLGNRTPSRGSSPTDDDTPNSGNKCVPAPEVVYPSKTVSKRKSRLRLTFWKRRNSISQ